MTAESALSLERIAPTPPELVGTTSPAMCSVVDWSINHWGTKWDIRAATVEASASALIYRFDTAWAPPAAAIAVAADRSPTLTFVLEYDESGCDFWGATVWVGGVAVTSEVGQSKQPFPALWEREYEPELVMAPVPPHTTSDVR